jgi:hypothetical protein
MAVCRHTIARPHTVVITIICCGGLVMQMSGWLIIRLFIVVI